MFPKYQSLLWRLSIYSFSKTFWNTGASSRPWGCSRVSTHTLPDLKAIESIYWTPCSPEETRPKRFGQLDQLAQPVGGRAWVESMSV